MASRKITDILSQLYTEQNVTDLLPKIDSLLSCYGQLPKTDPEWLNESDILLITYADTLQSEESSPLAALEQFSETCLKDLFSFVHLLPFFPFSSDDGFSVIDYRQVNPSCGDWSDIEKLGKRFGLCFDLVVNHVSAKSHYFLGFLAGDPRYKDFFIAMDPDTDVSKVVRPRTWPLFHRYKGAAGDLYCWTTFSEDQIDWNVKNPDVLLELIDILLFYVSRGAKIIRLDAIAYLWKELGTNCIHLPQTHRVVQLFRALLEELAPTVLLMTETNVPHRENISYFGDGHNESQIVYNFPLPPLILHTLSAQNASRLTEWAGSLHPVSPRTTFLNFTASHDGIGVRPAADLLSPEEYQNLIHLAMRHNGHVSCKTDSSTGESIPYELNLNYFDALNNPNDDSIPEETQIQRFLLSQSIALTLRGMPAVYIHSLLGSRNWNEGVRRTGQPRSINRETLNLHSLEQE